MMWHCLPSAALTQEPIHRGEAGRSVFFMALCLDLYPTFATYTKLNLTVKAAMEDTISC